MRRQEQERRETAYKEEAASQEAFKILECQVSVWQDKYNEKEIEL